MTRAIVLDKARTRAAEAVERLIGDADPPTDELGLRAMNEHAHSAFVACLVAALADEGVDPVEAAALCNLDRGGLDFWLDLGAGYLASPGG